MSEAIYGLVGALGGALITSAAAYWGPLQVQRRLSAAEAERSETARREAEAARAEAQRQADQERVRSAALGETERLEAAAVEAHALREAKINRIISMRTTTRTWSDLLARAVQDLELGRHTRIEKFDSEVAIARDKAQAAFDGALREGMWIPQSSYGFPLRPTRPDEQFPVLTALKHVTELIRAAVIRGEPLNASQSSDMRQALDRADGARGALSTALLNRLEEVMSVTVIDASARTITAASVNGSRRPSNEADLGRDPVTGLSRLEVSANGILDIAQMTLEHGGLSVESLGRVMDRVKDAVEMYLRLHDLTGRTAGRLAEALELQSEFTEGADAAAVSELEARLAEKSASALEHVEARTEDAVKHAREAERLALRLLVATGNRHPHEAAKRLRQRASEMHLRTFGSDGYSLWWS